jgi:dTMP kinase
MGLMKASSHARSRGMFITFEGGEGSGKSTQCKRLLARLTALRINAVATREPGGSPGAERIRQLLLEQSSERFTPLAEVMLFYAARSEHLEKLIRPTLSRGDWVICDRFSDSTRAYQGLDGRIKESDLEVMEQFVVRDTKPDLTFLMDVPAAEGLKRAAKRRGDGAVDPFEKQSLGYHVGLRGKFRAMAGGEPDRWVIIDATEPADVIEEQIWQVVTERFKSRKGGL